ncbi:Serine--tRNA ligase [Candidatus Fokinia solitaria]|uniref:Serine--tRNA ligase n=1 Tax=Candidatus Fokinia solitaria TaxID=1802984 RepID=A0A2U8BRW6_9RICK|nr:serine--tRNA ligase [Candidatus Fokinia solitaria]AWD33079.1 Serine--tRNA ligase [Candidatus Fokinia solitaria]
MYNIEYVKNSPVEFDNAMRKRKMPPLAAEIIRMFDEWKRKKNTLQDLNTQKNEIASQIAIIKRTSADYKKEEMLTKSAESIRALIVEASAAVTEEESKFKAFLSKIPNILDSRVPEGNGEDDNVVIREVGEKRHFSFKPIQHFEIGENLHSMNFEKAAEISGSRFVHLYGDLAVLERALANFMLDHHRKNSFLEISVPVLVKEEAMFNAGQLPKFDNESFKCDSSYRLIPTAEVPLVNLLSNCNVDITSLPKRFMSHTQCFRSEAGSAGKDTRGMIRVHQFSKVELVTVTTEDTSEFEHQYMLNSIETLMQSLGFHYRVVLLCSGDIGFTSALTYDIEVWLPGQQKYREISSCSNCMDFQARRMLGRYFVKDNNQKKVYTFLHTLNGSGVAVGRALVAVLENYQNEDGTVDVPEVLIPYCNGLKKIVPNKIF